MLELNMRRDVAAAFRPPPGSVRLKADATRLKARVRLKADATDLDGEIARTNLAIDDLVYELYGITEEERKIIEGNL